MTIVAEIPNIDSFSHKNKTNYYANYIYIDTPCRPNHVRMCTDNPRRQLYRCHHWDKESSCRGLSNVTKKQAE